MQARSNQTKKQQESGIPKPIKDLNYTSVNRAPKNARALNSLSVEARGGRLIKFIIIITLQRDRTTQTKI